MEFKNVPSSPRTPDGYRLATLEETQKNFNKLKREGILNDTDTLRVLDGITGGGFQLDISQWLWADNMLVFGLSSTEVSRKGSGVFRTDLYSNITLDDANKEDALRLSLHVGDIEVIHWLRDSTSQPHLANLILIFQETEARYRDLEETVARPRACGFALIVRMLLLESPETPDDNGFRYILSYALTTKLGSHPAVDADYALAVAEIVLNKFQMNFVVDSAIEQIVVLLTQPVGMLSTLSAAKLITMLTKLLSASTHTLAEHVPIIEGHFEKILKEAVHRGYVSLVEGLLDLLENINGQLVANVDEDGKTLLHYAAEWERGEPSDAVSIRLFEAYKGSFGLRSVQSLDKRGRSVLHLASFSGRARFCKILVADYELQGNAVDYCQQNLLHYAAKGDFAERIMNAFSESFANLIHKKNKKGETPLHVAVIYGKIEIVKKMIILLSDEALKDADYGGRTPLHLAAREGHLQIVKRLLASGSDPLDERDIDGKTALHYAVMSTQNASELVNTILAHYKSSEEKALLASAWAADIGPVYEMKDLDPIVKTSLIKDISASKAKSILEKAAIDGNCRLIWELLHQGCNISSISEMPEFRRVREQIDKFSEKGTDLPATKDTLGRGVIAECIAAHFLNPYIKSPITVSVTGGNGTGKSSMLNLIEAELLTTAGELAFLPSSYETFSEAREILNVERRRIRTEIETGLNKLLSKDIEYKKAGEKGPVEYLLEAYRPEYKHIYKSLASMDFNQQLNDSGSVYQSNGQSLGAVPRILTANFNAGNYRGRIEAWSGLALEITKQIESSMTRAQLFSTCWRNGRRNNSKNFYFKFIFPGLLLTILAACIGWAAWKLLDRSSVKELKYGSIAATVIAIVWASINAVLSVFSPVSKQMKGYFSLPDYSEWTGYQQKVIADIQFLKEEIGRKPYFIFSFIAGEKCKYWFGLWKDSIEGTPIPKYGSAPKDKLRIIAFVDDLDHCEDEVILRVLWAINLVFRVCEINVILAMDKNTIEEALKNSSRNQEKDFVDKFISKIIQLPVNLPDPEDDEWNSFLEAELEREPSLSKAFTPVRSKTDRRSVNLATEESQEHFEETRFRDNDVESGLRNFEGCIPFLYACLIQRVPGISSFWKNVLNWQKWILNILYLFACNVKDQSWPLGPSCEITKPLTKRMRDLREILMTSYTSAEVQTFNSLKIFATGNKKVPREWKNYLNYHKFARIIVSKKARKASANYPLGWEMEFVAWTFACWQWKHEMNVLIQDWGMYLHKVNGEQPSLKDIVVKYIEHRWPQWQPQAGGREIDESILVKNALDTIHDVSIKGVQAFKELSFKGAMSDARVSIEGKGYSPMEISRLIKEDKKEGERWNNFRESLDTVKDVSMEGIQCFQHFRFHCEPKNLSRS